MAKNNDTIKIVTLIENDPIFGAKYGEKEVVVTTQRQTLAEYQQSRIKVFNDKKHTR